MTTSADSADGRFPRITEEGLDALRRRIGVRIQDSLEPWCHEATRDNIRHYAHGIGDDNPLWCDPAYARTTRYGDVIAPPSFLFACSRIISGYVGGLPGIHAMWAGADWRWHRVVPRNAEVHTEAWLKDLVLHETRFAGRAVQQIYHVDFYDGDGNLLCGADSWCFRTERDTARERGTKYDEVRRRGDRRYTPEELDEVFRRYAGERARGAEPRRFADVKVGDTPSADAEGSHDGDRIHLLRAGLGRALHPREPARVAADRAALGARDRESLRHSRLPGAGPLGGRVRGGGGGARRL